MIIDAYDLISLLSSMEAPPSSLSAKTINHITKDLAANGVESRFYMSSFEAIQIEYPGCIHVSRMEISISLPQKLCRISPKSIDEHIIKLIQGVIDNGRKM